MSESTEVTERDKLLAKLREPFAPEQIGQLPRVTCKDCIDKHCSKHQKAKCKDCGAYVSTAHIHLSYVGHAVATDRLLNIDPEWNWEPFSFTESGAPALERDSQGRAFGFWIRLTICGVTRIGFGSVIPGSFDAEKQLIGDAIRNAAMRFGVALDLWSKEDLHTQTEVAERVSEKRPEPTNGSRDSGEPIAEHQKKQLGILSTDLGYDDETRHKVAAVVLKLESLNSFNDLSKSQADKVISEWNTLRNKKRKEEAQKKVSGGEDSRSPKPESSPSDSPQSTASPKVDEKTSEVLKAVQCDFMDEHGSRCVETGWHTEHKYPEVVKSAAEAPLNKVSKRRLDPPSHAEDSSSSETPSDEIPGGVSASQEKLIDE